MNNQTVKGYEKYYQSPDDIDLWSAGVAERPLPGSMVGPTFACIIGQQFLNLRKGDRFWYEAGDHAGAFTTGQLQEIRTASLARVVCDCMDDVEKLQPFLFLQPDNIANVRTACRGNGRLTDSLIS